MNEAEKASSDYLRAKLQYVQDVGILKKLVENSQKKSLTQEYKKKIEERKQKVHEEWEKVKEMRIPYLLANNLDEKKAEKWEKTQKLTFLQEEQRKRHLVNEAEQMVEDDYDSGCSARSSSSQEDYPVMDKITDTLSKVTVSRHDLVEFKKLLSEQLVYQWKEESQCEIFRGFSELSECLDVFQESLGFDERVYKAFLAATYGDDLSDKVKSFTCKTTELDGTYGMFAVSTQPLNEDGKIKLDVCYSTFTFKTALLGYNIEDVSEKDKVGSHKRINQKNRNKTIKDILLKTQVDDVMTGEKDASRRHQTVKDITTLTQNFIVAKALQGFADKGVIPFVKYAEDSASQLSQLRVTDVLEGDIVYEHQAAPYYPL